MQQHGRLCLVPAELMVVFLMWTLRMLLAMCCYQISMLLLVSGISRTMFNSWEGEEVWKSSQVIPWLKWIMRCIQICRRWSRPSSGQWNPCRTEESVRIDTWARICTIDESCVAWWGGRRKGLPFLVTIVRNWLLYWANQQHTFWYSTSHFQESVGMQDGHTATKLNAKIVGRTIIVRDTLL